jgi:phosphoribosylformimino-5-aminoimidazole carboxamide ribotide isomerase
MIVIPAIDIIDGKCVRLSEGDFSTRKEYSADPVHVARRFEDAGLTHLHVVDLDGARTGSIVHHKLLSSIASSTELSIDFGGGLKSDSDVKLAFDSGARQVTGGSIAVKNVAVFRNWIREFGPDRIILGADVRDGKIAVSGWQETTDLLIGPFVEEFSRDGIRYSIVTEISRDGRLTGPDFQLYASLQEQFPEINWVASGGVSGADDLRRLEKMGMYGAIVGKAFYEGHIRLEEMVEINQRT